MERVKVLHRQVRVSALPVQVQSSARLRQDRLFDPRATLLCRIVEDQRVGSSGKKALTMLRTSFKWPPSP